MTTNPYFELHTHKGEQELIDDLTVEAIQGMGMDCYYLPRATVKLDNILGEDVLSSFAEKYEIEVYVKSVEGWLGEGGLFKKFGWEIRDQMTLNIAKSRFSAVLGDSYTRPRPGDLIFFPLTNTLFTIASCTQDQLFFQAGSLYIYEVKVELFQYTQQSIETGIPEIDVIGDDLSYTSTFRVEAGSGVYVPGEYVYQGVTYAAATATAEVSTWDPMELKVKNITGIFAIGEELTGQTSGAVYNIGAIDGESMPEDPIANNKDLSTEAEVVLDWSENNPFSEKF